MEISADEQNSNAMVFAGGVRIVEPFTDRRQLHSRLCRADFLLIRADACTSSINNSCCCFDNNSDAPPAYRGRLILESPSGRGMEAVRNGEGLRSAGDTDLRLQQRKVRREGREARTCCHGSRRAGPEEDNSAIHAWPIWKLGSPVSFLGQKAAARLSGEP